MAIETLKERVTRLESKLQEVEGQLANQAEKNGERNLAGINADNSAFKRAEHAEGAWRNANNPQDDAEMRLHERITIDPEICHGKPTIRGLRYPVTMILELLSAGMTTEEILADYEDLEREDIPAALDYATRHLKFPPKEPAAA